MTFFEVIPDRVKEETEDRIVLVRECVLIAFFGLFMTVLGLVFCYVAFIGGCDGEGGVLPLVLIVVGF